MKQKKTIEDFWKFALYVFVGIVFVILNIILLWLVIDLLKVPTWFGSSAVTIFLFITKYYSYVAIKLFNKNFIKYAATNVFYSILTIPLVSLSIDFLKIPTLISSSLIVGGMFILRFGTFKKIGLIREC